MEAAAWSGSWPGGGPPTSTELALDAVASGRCGKGGTDPVGGAHGATTGCLAHATLRWWLTIRRMSAL
ncbi:MAG: hypothetical protein O2973_09670 [Gemmatimonadetes bacterium]|nr:hypothetical protein [Gemmatimonadota bacterium]